MEEKKEEYLARGGVSDSKAYQTETVVCGLLTRKKRNTNSFDRTGLFFGQTVVQ